jgi:ParB-like chromosome segregation protein Spo0J
MPTDRDRLLLARERLGAMKLERSRLAAEARDSGLSHADIARVLGISKTRVQQLLKDWDTNPQPGPIDQKTDRSSPLDDLPPVVAELVATGALTPDVARQLNKLADKQVVARLAADAVRWNWTRSQAVTAARARGAELDPEDMAVSQPRSAPVGDYE